MAVGDTIYANDPFAALRTSMNSILNGTGVHGGYNQGHSITANPSSGNTIDDAYFDSLRSAAAKIANYYNITNPFPAVNAGDLVRWSDYAEDATTFKNDIETRFNSPWSYSSGWDMTMQQKQHNQFQTGMAHVYKLLDVHSVQEQIWMHGLQQVVNFVYQCHTMIQHQTNKVPHGNN